MTQSDERPNASEKPPTKALHKHVRVSPEQWQRLEAAAAGTPLTANQVLVELAMEALDRREWPGTETEVKVARASLFAAQAIARRLIADGREQEVQEIRDFITTIVPDPDSHQPGQTNSPTGTEPYGRESG